MAERPLVLHDVADETDEIDDDVVCRSVIEQLLS